MLAKISPPVNLEEIREIIKKYREGDSFLRLMSEMFGYRSYEFSQINKAHDLIVKDFANIRRHTGEEYVEHPRATAIIAFMYRGDKNHISVIERLLHDLIEDVPDRQLIDIFSTFGAVVTHTVNGVTKPIPPPQRKKCSLSEYRWLKEALTFDKIKCFGRRSMSLKCDDRLHNMITLWGTTEKKIEKVTETMEWVIPMSIRAGGILLLELITACEEQLEKIRLEEETK